MRSLLRFCLLIFIFFVFLCLGVVYSKNKEKIKFFAKHRVLPGCKLADYYSGEESYLHNAKNITAPYYFSSMGYIYKTLSGSYSVVVENPKVGTTKKISEVEEPDLSEFSLHLKKKGKILADHKLGVAECVKFQVDLCKEFDTEEGTFIFFTSKLQEIPDELTFFHQGNEICSLALVE